MRAWFVTGDHPSSYPLFIPYYSSPDVATFTNTSSIVSES